MKKRWLSLGVSVTLLLLLTGCGGNEAENRISSLASVVPVSTDVQPLNYADRYRTNIVYPLRNPFNPLVLETGGTTQPAGNQESQAPFQWPTASEGTGNGASASTPVPAPGQELASGNPVLLKVYRADGTDLAYFNYHGRYYDLKVGEYLEDYRVSSIDVANGVVELEKDGSKLFLSIPVGNK